MRILFFDTETTGLPRRGDYALDDPTQPHIVSIAAILEQNRQELASINLIARHKGWTSHPGALEVHKIDDTYANQVGIDEMALVYAFMQLREAADLIVAHNVNFDKYIIDIACMRYGIDNPFGSDWYCTMSEAKNRGHKGKLSTAYEEVLGRPMLEQHTAMGDTIACKELYYVFEE